MTAFIRAARCLAVMGRGVQAIDFAKSQYGLNSSTVKVLEKQILNVNDLQGDFDLRAAQRDFIALVRGKSLIGRLSKVSSFRTLPAGTPILKQLTIPAASWVAEGTLIPTTGSSFSRIQNKREKLAAIIVQTNEVLRGVGEDFESALSRDIVAAIATLEGSSFIDPNNAGTPGEMPASILHGITPLTATPNPKFDLVSLVESFNGDLDSAVFVMRPETAVALAALGYDGIGARGGELLGLPAVTSNSLPTDSSGTLVALIDPAGILLSDDGVEFSAVDETTLSIGEDSNGDPEFVSLFQQNLSAIRAIRYISWQATRPVAAWLSGVSW